MERCHESARYDLAYGMDPYNYDRLAFNQLPGLSFFPGAIHSLPGYQIFLNLFYRVVGRNLHLIWLLQAGLGAICSGLTYLIARKFIGEQFGWIAALITALYGPAIFYESVLMPATMALCSVLCLWSGGHTVLNPNVFNLADSGDNTWCFHTVNRRQFSF